MGMSPTLRMAVAPVLAVLAVGLLAVPLPWDLGARSPAVPPISSGAFDLATTRCGCSPAALYISMPEPNFTLRVGDRVNVTYQFEVRGYNASFRGVEIHVPSAFANFYPAKGAPFEELLPQRNFSIAGRGWQASAVQNLSKVVSSNITFGKTLPYLSTQRLAVMANASFGSFRLVFRWRWTDDRAGAPTFIGNWSNLTEGYHHQDLITPAPLIWVLPTTLRTWDLGSTFVAHLYGLVANQGTWLLEMEYPNGSVVSFEYLPGPNGSTLYFNATLPLQSQGGRIPPGQMLIHIHVHGAIIWSLTVHLVAPSNTTVAVSITPAGCGPVKLDGVAFTNGTRATYSSGSTLSLSVTYCPGIYFHGWTEKGGGIQVGALRTGFTNATLYYNSTLIATYG
jgi:hypothetical protein